MILRNIVSSRYTIVVIIIRRAHGVSEVFFSCSCCLGLPFGKACLLEILALGPEVQALRKDLKVSPLYTAQTLQQKLCGETGPSTNSAFAAQFSDLDIFRNRFGIQNGSPGAILESFLTQNLFFDSLTQLFDVFLEEKKRKLKK